MKLDLFNHKNINNIANYLESRNIELDVLIGGPPCQGFSLAGKREADDERNKLYRAMVQAAFILKPNAVVLENVPGMLTLYDGSGKKRIFEDFENLGYKMYVKILYAPDYGIPQIRKRAIFVGLRDHKYQFEFPKPLLNPKEYITCEEAIGDLPALEGIYGEEIQEYTCDAKTDYQRLMRKNSDKIYNHIGTIHSEKTIKMISMIPEGKNYKALPEEELAKRTFKYHEALTRYDRNKPSRTIDTGHRTHFHYKWNRIPTVREAARLQSFPDDFIFYGNKQEQYKQVGNAAPPLLGKAIALKVKELLDSEKN